MFKRAAFTLIELTLVTAIILVLVGMTDGIHYSTILGLNNTATSSDTLTMTLNNNLLRMGIINTITNVAGDATSLSTWLTAANMASAATGATSASNNGSLEAFVFEGNTYIVSAHDISSSAISMYDSVVELIGIYSFSAATTVTSGGLISLHG